MILTTELLAPAFSQPVDNTLVAGYPTVIGLAVQQAPALHTSQAGRNAERLLFERAVTYLHQGNQAEEELAALLHLTLSRPLPTLVTVGGELDVVSLLDAPLRSAWQGLYLDADLRTVEVLGGVAPSGSEPAALFLTLAGLHHSYLEHQVFEEGFGVAAVSTARLLAQANVSGTALALLDAANIDARLPGLNLPSAIAADIAASVRQGATVTLPAGAMRYEDWSGYGYLAENGSGSGWMLAGGIAGGMTALNPERWPAEYRDILGNPGSDFSNNPLAAVELRVIRGPDILAGTAGQELDNPLQVLALDQEKRRVKGVTVTFTVRAGGGRIRPLAGGNWGTTATVTTGQDGLARVELLCPESTAVNPTTARKKADMTVQRVDETVLEVVSDTGLQTDDPVTVATFPDVPHHLNVRGGGSAGTILTWSATLVASVADQYDNPINKVPVRFSMGAAQPKATCDAQTDNRPGLLVANDAPCMQHIPVYGECGSATLEGETALHTGAVAQVLLGGRPDAVYPIMITAGGLQQTATVTANPTGPCDPGDAPYRALVLRLIHTADNLGHVIDGGPVSKESEPHTIPLLARLYAVREQEEVTQKEFACLPSGTDTCPVLKGTGKYNIDTNFVTAAVTFDGTSAAPLGDGLFRVDYPLPASPQKKEFQVIGQATEKVRVTAQVCDQRNDCLLVEEDQPLPEVAAATAVFGVDITLPHEHYLIPVNEQGRVTYDTAIPFTIAPPDYTAATSYFVLKKETAPGTFADIAWFNAKTRGQDEMTFLRGFGLDLGGTYRAQVVLNEGSQVMEVRSREMTLQPLALELDADLNRDGQFSEDDPQEHLAPGLVVPLNRDDDDHDGVVDAIDGYNANGIAPDGDDAMKNANGETVQDDDLIEVKLRALQAALDSGTVTLEILQGTDKIKVWTDRQKGIDHLLIDGTADPARPAKSWKVGTDIATIAGLPQSVYIEGIVSSQNEADTAILATTYRAVADPTQEIETDRLRIAVLATALVPDYDRNGRIEEQDRNKVTTEKPWRFWVNDDHDGGADAAGIGGSGDDLPGQNRDNSDNQVNTIRDLLDFFPLYLDIGQALRLWPSSEGYAYVVHDRTALKPSGAKLGIVEGMAGSTVLSAETMNAYLEDMSVGREFAAQEVKPVDAEGVALSPAFLASIGTSGNNGVLLVEGRQATTAPLTLEISRNGAVVHTVSLPLEIVSVEEMFGHKNLRHIAGPPDGDPDRSTDIDPQAPGRLKVGADQEIGKQPYCMQGVNKSLVWIHGYNNSPADARATFSEVFKRFFHAGLTGRFYGVSWFGNPEAPFNTSHYHQAVVNAFATAGAYKKFIDAIPGTTSLAAHSLGNMVVGAAIQDHSLTNFDKYFAIDAAVALEAYGQVVDVAAMVQPDGSISPDPNADMIRVKDWPEYIAGGQTRLLASEWYTLFAASDNRHQLTWRNRLGSVSTDKVYNFYSSTEDVLRSYADDDLYKLGELLDAVKEGEAAAYMSIAAWVKQEKYKGQRSLINIASNFCGVASSYCGWRFYTDWDVTEYTPDNKPIRVRRTPAQAATITEGELRAKPFFSLPTFKLFGADLAELVSDNPDDPAPSAFVMKNISETELTTYYEANKPAHGLVKIRDWLLAEAFPATTLPMGANYNDELTASRNIDISGVKDNNGGCCKTSEELWPLDRKGDWKHSDYKDIPYQHTFEFYNKII